MIDDAILARSFCCLLLLGEMFGFDRDGLELVCREKNGFGRRGRWFV
jgi:hypothetical protein